MLLMMVKMTIETVVEIKHRLFELFLLRVVRFVCFLSSVSKEAVLSVAASIQENTVGVYNTIMFNSRL